MLPREVIDHARDELGDWHGCGMSIMEVSHRGKQFAAVAEKSEEDLRTLLALPDDFAVLFLQGGATTQFAAVPMNLTVADQTVAYVNTGSWSKKAIAEARKFCNVKVVADAEATGYTSIPPQEAWDEAGDAAYLHYCANETIGGVEFRAPPRVSVPLVSDMSSNFMSRPIDFDGFDVIYAGAQKNIGPAGLTVVLVRRALLDGENQRQGIPSTLNYAALAKSGSMLNTPPTFAWYMAGLVFGWLLENGGLDAMAKRNDEKAALLYKYIDASDFYANPVQVPVRSRMNIPFTLADSSLDNKFLDEAATVGLLNLKGHRSVGGMRASIYNAMPLSGVEALISFMQDFQSRNG